MPGAASDDLSLNQVKALWELFGEATDGPREARAIFPDKNGTVSRCISKWPELRDFCNKYAGEAMLCLTVNPLREGFPHGRAARDADVPHVTTVFLDFDAVDGNSQALKQKVVPKVDAWCEAHQLGHFQWADSGAGLHAYAQIPPIYIQETPDVGQRLATLQREIRTLFEGDTSIRVDSVANLSRVVKLVGTRKVGGRLSRFLKKPEIFADDCLRQWLLDLKIEAAAAPGEVSPTADLASAREEIEAAVGSSAHLFKLRQLCQIANDRSKAEYAFVRELWLRRYTGAQAVAAVRVGIPGSKSAEAGYKWALNDTTRIFRECEQSPKKAPHEPEIDETWWTKIGAYVQNPTEADWLLKPFIAKGAQVILAGDPKTGKSFVAMDLAMRAAKAGHTTAYIAAEGPPWDWARRLSGLAKGHEIKDLDKLPMFMGYKPKRVDLTDPATLTSLRQRILDCRPVLVVLDPLRLLITGNENDSEVAAKMTAGLEWLIEDLPVQERPAFIVIHHLRRQLQSGKKQLLDHDERPSSRLRGSTQFWANADSIASITFVGDDENEQAKKEHSKRAILSMEHRFHGELKRRVVIQFVEEKITVRYCPYEVFNGADGHYLTAVLELLSDGVGRSVKQIRSAVHGKSTHIGLAIQKLCQLHKIALAEDETYQIVDGAAEDL